MGEYEDRLSRALAERTPGENRRQLRRYDGMNVFLIVADFLFGGRWTDLFASRDALRWWFNRDRYK